MHVIFIMNPHVIDIICLFKKTGYAVYSELFEGISGAMKQAGPEKY